MWVDERTYEILGTRFRIRSDEPGNLDLVVELLSQFTEVDRPVRPDNTFSIVHRGDERARLYRNCRLVSEGRLGRLAVGLMVMINRTAVENLSEFGAHAGVFGSERETIAVIGRSGAGKSTLTASALLAGFSYGSDEALIIDYDNRHVVPYPKPLGLSKWSQEQLGVPIPPAFEAEEEALVTPERFGAALLPAGRTVSILLIPSIGDGEPKLSELARSDGVVELLTNSFNHYKRPQDAYELAVRMSSTATVLAIEYADPRRAANRMADEFL